jgi:hypothetical protein
LNGWAGFKSDKDALEAEAQPVEAPRQDGWAGILLAGEGSTVQDGLIGVQATEIKGGLDAHFHGL